MRTLRLLIVDDEPLIRLGIRQAVSSMAGVEIAGECGSGAEAIAAIADGSPDLVLLDVQMPGGTGFDVVDRLGADRMPPVIFVTAFDQYAVQAFEVNAVDYLLKPFDAERVRHAVERARRRIAAESDGTLAERLQAVLSAREAPVPDRIAVRTGERFEFVAATAIDWVQSADNYVELHCGARRHLIGETLTSFERRLDPRAFLRIHRRRIVNTARIVAVHPLIGGTYELELQDGTRLTSGRTYREVVRQLIR